MSELEQAFREGYSFGYSNGQNDTAAYERGFGKHLEVLKRDKDQAWEDSDTKDINGL